MPNLSVAVPTYNGGDTLEKCLRAIKESTYRDYELIVVDCGSRDATSSIAKKYADNFIEIGKNGGRSRARTESAKAARGKIIVNIDHDIVIKPDTLTRVTNYFSKYQDIDALTGLLSKEHPNTDFFSQYKNLYMHYIFKKLPKRVTFLYGSIYALRREIAQVYDPNIKIADDTALGQKLITLGKKIAFLKDLEVAHLKKYNLLSFIRNDFQIPFDWAKIFLKYKGWRQLGKYKTGYAHSPKQQLLSVILAPTIFLLSVFSLLGYFSIAIPALFISIWIFLNFQFLAYLAEEKGLFFGISSFFITLLDNIIMAAGILCGFAAAFIKGLR